MAEHNEERRRSGLVAVRLGDLPSAEFTKVMGRAQDLKRLGRRGPKVSYHCDECGELTEACRHFAVGDGDVYSAELRHLAAEHPVLTRIAGAIASWFNPITARRAA